MAIKYLPHQPIQFYKVAPTSGELLIGQRQWSNTAYHNRLGSCFFIGSSYCHPVLNTDFMTFQFKAETTGVELFQPFFAISMSDGSATSTSANHLVDSGANFVADGIQADWMVFNTTDNTTTTVANVDSSTDLELNSDLFTSGENYYISKVSMIGTWTYDFLTAIGTKATTGAGSFEADNILTVDSYYKVTITITDITAGSISIKLGNNTIATLTSVGTHTVYGQCTTVPDFQIINSTSFIGSFNLGTVELYELQTTYTIGIFDINGVYQNAIAFTADGNELTIGNVAVNIQWSEFALTCGQYIVALYSGDVAPCVGNMVFNGKFIEGASGWTLGTNMTVTSGHVEFLDAPTEAILENSLSCPIISGNSYTITFDVAAVDGGKYGKYVLPQFSVLTEYGINSQTSVSLTLTAIQNSDVFQIYLADTSKAQFDNFTITCNDCVLDWDNADGLSECYCICDSQNCTVLMKYKSDRNVYGEYFDENSSYMYYRIPGRLRNVTPNDNDFGAFNSTMDSMVQPYIKNQYNEELSTQLVPDHVHKTLAIALSHKTVLLDGVQYTRIGAYTPNHKDETELSNCIVNVAQTNQENLTNNY
jgi:hypothetical protein